MGGVVDHIHIHGAVCVIGDVMPGVGHLPGKGKVEVAGGTDVLGEYLVMVRRQTGDLAPDHIAVVLVPIGFGKDDLELEVVHVHLPLDKG